MSAIVMLREVCRSFSSRLECEKWRACEYIQKRTFPCDIGDRAVEILGVDSTYSPNIVIKVYEAMEWSEMGMTLGGVALLLLGQFLGVRRYMRKKREKKAANMGAANREIV